jgi:hypothetical protein
MDVPTLMQKLMEMTRALDSRDTCAVRNLIIETQEGVLALERENECLALENVGLHQRLDAARLTTLTAVTQTRNAEPIASSFIGEPSSPDTDNTNAPRTHIWRTTHFFRT